MSLTRQVSFLSGTPVMHFGTHLLVLGATNLCCPGHDHDADRSIIPPMLLTDAKIGKISWDHNALSLGILFFYDMLLLHSLSFASLGCFLSYQVQRMMSFSLFSPPLFISFHPQGQRPGIIQLRALARLQTVFLPL
jgi:hypothetical protein